MLLTVISVAVYATLSSRRGLIAGDAPSLDGCQSVISMRDGSFFSGSHLKLNEIVEVSYWWACEASVFNKFCGSNHWGTHSNY